MPLALTHVDPRHPDAAGAVEGLASATGSFLVGGLTAAAGDTAHQAGGASGCLSGVALSPAAVEVATALSQGCTPLGRTHQVTRGKDNILFELDGRRALDVFNEDIGEELASDLRRVGGLIFAALPVAGSDTADVPARGRNGAWRVPIIGPCASSTSQDRYARTTTTPSRRWTGWTSTSFWA